MSIVLAPTITVLPADTAGAVIVSGSHGGTYPGVLAAKAGARAVIFSDAGIGLDEAGIASLPLLESHGMAAATISVLSARIGDAGDMMARGTISRVNAIARLCGVREGMACRDAATRLEAAPLVALSLPLPREARRILTPGKSRRELVLCDSAALVDPDADRGAIVVTGSHGGLVGGDPKTALKADAFAAFFNDAGIGADGAGTTRLAALDRRGIAAVTVAAASARIGDAQSTLENGIISRVNDTARRLGAQEGMPAADFAHAAGILHSEAPPAS